MCTKLDIFFPLKHWRYSPWGHRKKFVENISCIHSVDITNFLAPFFCSCFCDKQSRWTPLFFTKIHTITINIEFPSNLVKNIGHIFYANILHGCTWENTAEYILSNYPLSLVKSWWKTQCLLFECYFLCFIGTIGHCLQCYGIVHTHTALHFVWPLPYMVQWPNQYQTDMHLHLSTLSFILLYKMGFKTSMGNIIIPKGIFSLNYGYLYNYFYG